nr:MAG TPA: hypothetical protein [Crassvirales sp.]
MPYNIFTILCYIRRPRNINPPYIKLLPYISTISEVSISFLIVILCLDKIKWLIRIILLAKVPYFSINFHCVKNFCVRRITIRYISETKWFKVTIELIIYPSEVLP